MMNLRSSIAIERIKDTTQSEMQYLFTYKMQVFEKKYYENLNKQCKEFEEVGGNNRFSMAMKP